MAVSTVALTDIDLPATEWSRRALDVARVSAIFIVLAAGLSTAATSIGTVVFMVALAASGRLPRAIAQSYGTLAGKAILAYLACVLLSALWSDAGVLVGVRDFWAWRKLVFLFIALPLFMDDRWKLRLCVALTITCGVAVAASFGMHALAILGRDGGIGVVLNNHSTQSSVFAVAAACSAYLGWQARGWQRSVYAAVSIALVVNVLFFGSGRTGYLAVIGVAMYGAIVGGGGRRALQAGAGVAVVLLLAYATSPVFSTRVNQTFDEARQAMQAQEVTSVGIRIVFARNTLALISERPILGYGLGSFRPTYAAYVEERFTGVLATRSGDPHNQYLYIVFEQGLVGLLLFGLMIVCLYRSFPATPYGLLAGCALTAWCIGSLFSSHFRTFPESHFNAFFIAVLGAGTMRVGARSRDDAVAKGPDTNG